MDILPIQGVKIIAYTECTNHRTPLPSISEMSCFSPFAAYLGHQWGAQLYANHFFEPLAPLLVNKQDFGVLAIKGAKIIACTECTNHPLLPLFVVSCTKRANATGPKPSMQH